MIDLVWDNFDIKIDFFTKILILFNLTNDLVSHDMDFIS